MTRAGSLSDMTDDVNKENEDPMPDDIGLHGSETASRYRTFYIVGGALAVIALAAVIYLILVKKPEQQTAGDSKEDIVVSVKTAAVNASPIAQESTAVGTIVPAEQSTVSAGISAQIRQMGILKNTVVKKGQLLAVLSSEDLTAQRNEAAAALNEAKLSFQTLQNVTIPQNRAQSTKDLNDARAALDNARVTYERRKVLYEKGGIALKDLEASQLSFQNAQNAYVLAQKNAELGRTAADPNSRAIAASRIRQAQDRLTNLEVQAQRGEVRAPIDGVVTDQFQYEGEFASQGAKLLTIADISEIVVKAQFADTAIKDLKTGDAVTIFPAESPDEPMTGKVTLISRASDTQSRTLEVWARFGNPRGTLPAGGAVRMIVKSNAKPDALVVPAAAVTLEASGGDEGTVMVVGDDSVAHETKVKVGIKQGDKYEIVDGLTKGQTVVIEGNYSLPDGTRVEAVNDDDAQKD